MNIHAWAIKWRIPYDALADLLQSMGEVGNEHVARPRVGDSENAVQAAIMLEAPTVGAKLFRNNLGALPDARGVPVRYGLANQSAKQNKVIKSGDLIGWKKKSVAELFHAGVPFVAQFMSRECKPVDWTYSGTEHEVAQAAWRDLVLADGGDAQFATGPGTL